MRKGLTTLNDKFELCASRDDLQMGLAPRRTHISYPLVYPLLPHSAYRRSLKDDPVHASASDIEI